MLKLFLYLFLLYFFFYIDPPPPPPVFGQIDLNPTAAQPPRRPPFAMLHLRIFFPFFKIFFSFFFHLVPKVKKNGGGVPRPNTFRLLFSFLFFLFSFLYSESIFDEEEASLWFPLKLARNSIEIVEHDDSLLVVSFLFFFVSFFSFCATAVFTRGGCGGCGGCTNSIVFPKRFRFDLANIDVTDWFFIFKLFSVTVFGLSLVVSS